MKVEKIKDAKRNLTNDFGQNTIFTVTGTWLTENDNNLV